MYYYLNGTVAHIGPYLVVIDCGGVGYACRTTNHTISKLNMGKAAKLYTHLYVREEIFELYGFASESELGCFRMLIGVSGVGPKAALAILSSNTPEGLALAIVSGNEKALTVELHRPYIDEITVRCPECGKDMHRVPEVIDCWFDSGAMPFAQHHYPFENQDLFEQQFPAQFISEAVDQTRALLKISVDSASRE